ncbi:tRNA (guanosine(18)-2'-O)-methyltransferase TrmH [Pseudomaricurvus alkylphenolicus]|uniref:tRNA (guanosine(18)-2'-O)-methyltransferase TrmH n=1 Tax=Pseudomaricurvus alkylphenolicus TaxID=1306991 RepID=UPI0014241AA8|nr:tRNA (guanosine(18)-2'-O)-methyltransferase TrmH [Pseudomaricurvus alkylphenolicus]NIB41121.1 tRNA (guanosine(18)-2'-O)-methyltransferase TrmH [Pseudomaricurvus alkylphenolicus]
MTPERYQIIRRVLDQRQPDLTVITDEVHKGRNLSAIIRTCDAVGIDQFHCVQPSKGFRAFRGTALGSHKWVETQLHPTIETGVGHLKDQGFRIVAANLSDRAVDFRNIDYTQPTALLMGTEKEGVSDAALAAADDEVIIPMMGMVESFNVSVACAIILTEAQRQRQLAGLYNRSRLPADIYERKLFQWCQPIVTRYCDERGLDYPPLDDEGEIIDAPAWYRSIRERQELLE